MNVRKKYPITTSTVDCVYIAFDNSGRAVKAYANKGSAIACANRYNGKTERIDFIPAKIKE